MDGAFERPASTSSYFARPPPPSRLLLRVYAAEGLRHVSSHGTYCKIYVGSTDMVRGSGAFARHTQKLSASSSSHSLVELLHSPFGSSNGRINTAQPPTMPLPPTSSSEGDLGGGNSKMRVLKTQVQKGKRPNPVWNEKFDIPVLDPAEDVLSIRVKSARLMSSPAIGALAIPLKYLTMETTGTVDRWVDLKHGKKDAGRIRLQLRLVDPNVTRIQPREPQDDRPSRPRNHQNSDTYLSLPLDEPAEEVSSRGVMKSSRRTHKYHRSARRFDGTLLKTSSSRSLDGKKSDVGDHKTPATPTTPTRDNSASATSNESMGESEPASDASGSPSVSPLPKRSSIEDAAAFSDSEVPSVATKDSFVHTSETSTASTPSPQSTAVDMTLDASFANRGTMQASELERSRMKMAEISGTTISGRTSNPQVPQEEDDDDESDLGDLGDEDNRYQSTKRWTGNHTKLSVLSSTLDPRESSRVDFGDDDDDDAGFGKRKTSLKYDSNHWSASGALSSTATSTIFDARESSRMHVDLSDSESDDEDEEEDEAVSEKKREQQRQQWQLQQREMQLREVDEVDEEESESSSIDSESDDEDEDEFDDELELETPRMQITPTLAHLLSRQSMNVLFEEEEDTDDEVEPAKSNEEFVPILEATSPASLDFIDSALRQSRSFD